MRIRPLVEIEREAILSAVSEYQVPEAARLLGIAKTTLYRRLKNYGITLPLPDNGSSIPARNTPIKKANTPITHLLLLPSTAEELPKAILKCPRCSTRLIVPDQVVAG
jgi:hypothetical protein